MTLVRSPRAREGRASVALVAVLVFFSSAPEVAAQEAGSWGPVLELPTHPEQMAVLPSGKVLMWPWAPDRRTPPHGPLALWDPADGSAPRKELVWFERSAHFPFWEEPEAFGAALLEVVAAISGFDGCSTLMENSMRADHDTHP